MSGSKYVDLMVCLCVPAAIQLLQMGFFLCAPLGLTLAISLPVLMRPCQAALHAHPSEHFSME
ncbi:hypothetical protein F5141DRAFT_996085 [Pisolithus sp. B1]|nr:hypothetical protein F5141DRAFT_996085 [Pisolithus sp. B1]